MPLQRPTRILMLLENAPYPMDARVRSEAEALTEAGYRVAVIAPADNDQPWRERVRGVEVWRYPMPRQLQGAAGYLWEYAYSLAAAFVLSLGVWLRSGVDIVHAHNPPDTFFIIGAIFRLLGKKFVFDHHDLAPEMYAAKFGPRSRGLIVRILVWCERFSCRLADHVIATNESYRLMEMERGGVPADRITIVRNGPNLQRLQPVAPDLPLRRKAAAIFGYVGVMSTQDGVDYLLRALHHLRTDLGRHDWYCVIVGRGNALTELEALAARLDLAAHVWFTGKIPDADLIRYLSTADVCVDPDPSNPFNDRSTMIKVMEYMALGKPVVAFDLPEHRRTAAGAAVYVTPNDELAFARALAALIDDPDRREDMGRLGRHRAVSVLAWSNSVPALLSVYRQIEGAAPMPLPAAAEPPPTR